MWGRLSSRTISIGSRVPAIPTPAAATVAILATVVAAAVLLPAFYLVYRISGDWGAAWDTITGRRALDALSRTLLLAVAVAFGSVAIALPAAWLTARTDLPFARAWFVLLALPLAVPSYVAALAIVLFFGPRGMLQGWIEPLGVERLPSIYGFWGAWMALVFFSYPYVLLPVRAALLGLDRSFEEASRSLGRSPLATFVLVVLPQLRPALVAGVLVVSLYTLSDFGAVALMRFSSLSRIIYLQYEGSFNREAASALGLLLVVTALSVVALEGVLRGRSRYHGAGTARPPRKTALGRWKWPATGFLALVVAVSIVVPAGVLGHRVLVGLLNDQELQAVGVAARNSLTVAGLAAVATVVAALPLSYQAARRPGAFSAALERVSYAGYALPGIVIALSLVYFGANYAYWAYQTLGLLVFAMVVRFLPEATGPARAAFLRVNPRTEEAGRSLGRSPAVVFLRVTLPQVFPGLLAGGSLVFLTAMKELPITLLLSPIEFDTLAVQVWSLSSEAFYTRACYAASLLVLVSSAPVIALVLRERGAE